LIADTGSHRIVRLSMDGRILKIYGKHGIGKGEFDSPLSVSVGKDRVILVAENERIQMLDPKGDVKRVVPVGARVDDVVADSTGRFYVSSARGGFIKAYSSDGKLLGELRDPGGSGDPFRSINGIGITPDDVLLAVNGTTVWAWSLPGGKRK